jgi:hypothetical protein
MTDVVEVKPEMQEITGQELQAAIDDVMTALVTAEIKPTEVVSLACIAIGIAEFRINSGADLQEIIRIVTQLYEGQQFIHEQSH